eukprot:jgi/Hompol1/3955/HPOL_006843-RA
MVWGWATEEQVLVALVTLTMTAGHVAGLVNGVSYALGVASVELQAAFDVLECVPSVKVTQGSTAATNYDPSQGLQFHCVGFSYPAQSTATDKSTTTATRLNGITLSIPPATKIAIVGPSGSGKSSIISLAQQFYNPTSGTITLNNIPLGHWDLKTLRSQVVTVKQNPELFDISVRDNIAYGRRDATMDEVSMAARLANASDFIEALESGYDMLVGE